MSIVPEARHGNDTKKPQEKGDMKGFVHPTGSKIQVDDSNTKVKICYKHKC